MEPCNSMTPRGHDDGNQNDAVAGILRAVARRAARSRRSMLRTLPKKPPVPIVPRLGLPKKLPVLKGGLPKQIPVAKAGLPKNLPLAKVGRVADHVDTALEMRDALQEQQQQTHREGAAGERGATEPRPARRGLRAVIADEYRQRGFRGLARNVAAPLVQASVLGTVLFATYETAFQRLCLRDASPTSASAAPPPLPGSRLPAPAAAATAGALAGACHGLLSSAFQAAAAAAATTAAAAAPSGGSGSGRIGINGVTRRVAVDAVEFSVLFGCYEGSKALLVSAVAAARSSYDSDAPTASGDHAAAAVDIGGVPDIDWHGGLRQGAVVATAGGMAGAAQQYVSHALEACAPAGGEAGGTAATATARATRALAGPGVRVLAGAAGPAAIGFIAFEFASDAVTDAVQASGDSSGASAMHSAGWDWDASAEQ
eukprot:g4533.t1